MKYSIITEIKKSDKGNIYLAAIDSQPYPVVVKEIRYGDINVYEALKKVDTEYLPKIICAEKIEDGLQIIEEYVEGEPLFEYIRQRELKEEECFDIAIQLCKALKVLHNLDTPLIHRDVKPSNIIISPVGLVKLIDFDSSRIYKQGMETDTRFLGTEKYAPPEQYGFSQTDCRSDIYSLGVVLGQFSEYILTSSKKEWKRLVDKCTSFSPDNRYKNVDEIIEILNKIKKRKIILLDRTNIIKILVVIGLFIGGLVILYNTNDIDISQSKNSTEGHKEEQTEKQAEEDTEKNIEEQTEKDTEEYTEEQTEKDTEEYTEEQTEKDTEEYTEEQTEKDTEEYAEERTEKETESILDSKYTPEKEYYITPPEWRDIEGEDPIFVELKKEFRQNCTVVLYHFKDRMLGQDFYYQIREFEQSQYSLKSLKLCMRKNDNMYNIDEQYINIKDNIIIIDREYIDSLEEGYYSLVAQISSSDNDIFTHTTMLYIASSDVLEEQICWLQNTTFNYGNKLNEKVHLVVKNESFRKFDYLTTLEGDEINSSMYKILHNGRVLEITTDLINEYERNGEIHCVAVATDGSRFGIDIYR